MKLLRQLFLFVLFASAPGFPAAESPASKAQVWSRWPRTNFFPIAVWLQQPANAERYRAAGFNTFVALSRGPTEEQLAALKRAGMYLICEQNERALRHLEDPTIIGWMHGDEPDNAQELPGKKGWGPPIEPARIAESYRAMRRKDPTRPVLLNLGQGVAWDGWHGRGVRSRHPEDYPLYLEGCDMASFDIYPAVHDHPEVAGKLWYVAEGVDRLTRWSAGKHAVWNCLECTRIDNPDRKPTPREVRCEAWMSLIHGSRGLIYFVHQFKPTFREAALLDDPEMLKGVTALNQEILSLAPVFDSTNRVSIKTGSTNDLVPISTLSKRQGGTNYLFAVAMRDGTTVAHFSCQELSEGGTIEVINEQRAIPVRNGSFEDLFKGWEVHLYRWLPR